MVKLYEPRLCDCGISMVEMGNGDWVSYEDYAALEKILEWVCLNFNLYDLPPCEQRNKLEELGLL